MQDLWKLLAAGGLGVFVTWLTYWLVGKRKLRLVHRHRLIEKNINRIHRYAAYYWPYITLSRAVGGLLDTAHKTITQQKNIKTEEQKAEIQEQLKISFFRLAQWFHMYYKCWKDLGGVITVGDLTAESLLTTLLGRFPSSFDDEIGLVARHRLINVFESQPQVREFFNKFKEKLGQRSLGPIFNKYKQWLKNPEILSLAAELRCFSTLFTFEINMCYQSWYRRKPRRPKVDFNLVTDRLNKLIESQSVTLQDAKKYLRRLEAPNTKIEKLRPFC